VASGSGAVGQVTCFQCSEKGHMAQNCQKPLQGTESNDNQRMSGNEVRRTDSSHPTVSFLYSVGCVNREHSDYITLELDAKQGYKLHFLVDSRADISLVKSYKLLGTDEFEPKDRVSIKCVEGFIIETHSSIETWIQEGGIDIPYHLQLVSKQVDLKEDGILGHYFLKLRQA